MRSKQQLPDCCHKCGSNQFSSVRGVKTITRDIAGTLPNGYEFRAVQWTKKRCECGQLLTVRIYLP
jgi:hypothetical protein